MENDDNTKLITFRAPRETVDNFDVLIKLKRASRTAVLVEFMNNYLREEFSRMKESDEINQFISEMRGKQYSTTENEILKRNIRDLQEQLQNAYKRTSELT